MEKISNNILKNIDYIKEKTGNNIYIKIKNLMSNVFIVYNSCLISEEKLNKFLLENINFKKINKRTRPPKIAAYFKSIIKEPSLESESDFEMLFDKIFLGNVIVLINDVNYFISFNASVDLDRSITEPTTETVIYGPKDGFTENIKKNMGLIRKRIKSSSLWVKELEVGRETKTKVNIIYMENIASKELVNKVIKRIEKIDIDGIICTGNIRELIKPSFSTFFPTLLATERPDNTSRALLDGKVIIMVDNAPFVLITPAFFIDFLHSAEDYFQNAINSSIIRIIRFIAMLNALILPAYYVLLSTFDHELIPAPLLVNFTLQREGVPFPLIFEILLLSLIFEILREADIRLPSVIGSSISIVGALVIGQAAVQAGVVSTISLIVVAFTSICSLALPYVDFANSIKIWRFILVAFAAFFGNIGFLVGLMVFFLHLCSINVFDIPYLSPFAPLDLKKQKDAILRFPLKKLRRRSEVIAAKNKIRLKEID